MASAKYPLDPLLGLRERGVDSAKQELSRSVKAREGAEGKKARAEAARREAETRANAAREAERAALAGGGLRAVDLARADAWEIAAKAEADARDEEVKTAGADVDRARRAEAAALSGLTERKAEHAVVERDKERFRDREKKLVEKKEDEAGEEAFASRWVRRRDE